MKTPEEMCREMTGRMLESNKEHKPTVEKVIDHLETAYRVVQDGKTLCYCESEDAAEMIAGSVRISKDVAIMYFAHKLFGLGPTEASNG